MTTPIQTDVGVIGAGPIGLFSVFELGLLKLHAQVMDTLPHTGGQLNELYPEKPIYDIPGAPAILAKDLITNLEEQIAPFKPGILLENRVDELIKVGEKQFILRTSQDVEIHCKAVAIAGGLGSFSPRKPKLDRLDYFEEGRGVLYHVKNPEAFRDQKVVIAGGGDSALDWAIVLADIAAEISVIHRRDAFRGAPDTAEKVIQLADEGKLNLYLESQVKAIDGGDRLEKVTIASKNLGQIDLQADTLLPFFGLAPKLGPIESWGLGISKRHIEVDPLTFCTNVPGVYAIGDISTYPGKLKLILCGFHEAAMMARAIRAYLFPEEKQSVSYTSVSGVTGF